MIQYLNTSYTQHGGDGERTAYNPDDLKPQSNSKGAAGDFIQLDAKSDSPFYPSTMDGVHNCPAGYPGEDKKVFSQKITLYDKPFVTDSLAKSAGLEGDIRVQFTTCAVCLRKGKWTVLGCVEWGFKRKYDKDKKTWGDAKPIKRKCVSGERLRAQAEIFNAFMQISGDQKNYVFE